jgi:hypothetical protein
MGRCPSRFCLLTSEEEAAVLQLRARAFRAEVGAVPAEPVQEASAAEAKPEAEAEADVAVPVPAAPEAGAAATVPAAPEAGAAATGAAAWVRGIEGVGASIRHYTVWAHPLGVDWVGVHTGPHPGNWNRLIDSLPLGSRVGFRFKRYESQALAVAGYNAEAVRLHSPLPVVVYHWQ